LPCCPARIPLSASSHTLPYSDGEVGTDIVALVAPDAVVRSGGPALHIIVEFKHLFGADSDAKAAALAPFFVYFNLETLCQNQTPSSLNLKVYYGCLAVFR
jgi:hypothetical protein